MAQKHSAEKPSAAAFFRLSNRHITASLRRRPVSDTETAEYGFASVGDLALYAMIGTVLSNPSFTSANGGLQNLLLRHTRNRYFSLHGAFRRLCNTGYLLRTRISEGKNCFHDYYKLAHTKNAFANQSCSCLSYAEGSAFRASYRPYLPPREDYTEVSVPMLMDPSLSLAAKGLYIVIARYLRLRNYRPEIVLTKGMLQSVCGMGTNAFDRIFRELRRTGYLVLIRTKAPGTGYPMYEYRLNKTAEQSSVSVSQTADLPSVRATARAVAHADARAAAQTEEGHGHCAVPASEAEHGTGAAAEHQQRSLSDIRKNIDYDCLVQDYPHQRLDTVVSILSSYLSQPPPANHSVISIGGFSYPHSEIVSRMSSLDSEDIRFVLDNYDDAVKTREIRNIRKYLTACLFHAKENLALALDVLAVRTPGVSYT